MLIIHAFTGCDTAGGFLVLERKYRSGNSVFQKMKYLKQL